MKRYAPTVEEYQLVMDLLAEGKRICDIVKLTGLKRSCINNWVNSNQGITYRRVLKGEIPRLSGKIPDGSDPVEYLKSINTNVSENEIFSAYSFILGLYLGDGCISSRPRVKQIMFSLDNKYPILNEYVVDQLRILFNKKPQIYDRSKSGGNCSVYSIYSVNIGVLFPHEGRGCKHSRKIELQQWQRDIIRPSEIIKGLIMSDGCYFYDNTNKKYMYDFSNTSKDIVAIYAEYLNILGIEYSLSFRKRRKPNHKDSQRIRVHNRDNVAKLHNIIGDKNRVAIPYICEENIQKNKREVPKKFEVSKEELEKLVKEKPMTEIGKMFGVSDNAVKKRCKRLGIELTPMRGHWVKLRSLS